MQPLHQVYTDKNDVIHDIYKLLSETSELGSNEIKILVHIINDPRITGRDLSNKLGIPDSKVYPALKNLVNQDLIKGTDNRPSTYWIDDVKQIIEILQKQKNERDRIYKQNLIRLENLMDDIWEPSPTGDLDISYIVKHKKLKAELQNLMKSATESIDLILSIDVIELLGSRSIYHNIIKLIKKGINVNIALPKPIQYEITGKSLQMSEDNSEIKIPDKDILIQLKQYYVDGKFTIKESLMNTSAYIVRDKKVVAHIFHHPTQSFAIISSDPDFLNIINGCWDGNTSCVRV